jgi:LPXTG-motif cell wall-anchored protein
MSRSVLVRVVMSVVLALMVVPAVFAQSGTAKVRVVHASPDAPAVDVYVDGNKVLSNVAFFAASDYLDVPAGEHRFQVTPAGAAADAAVIDATATVAAGSAYSVVATGKVADIKGTILADNLAAPAAGKAHVRVVHASPDTPAVDVKVRNGPTLISSLAFPNASDYLPVDAGSYDLIVTPAGSDTVALDLGSTALEAGKIYDVLAVGLSADGSLKVEVTTPPAQAAAPPAAPAGNAPAQLPNTSGETTPLLLFGFLAALLIGGGLLLRRRLR